MANENEVEVDLLTSDQGLNAEMAKVAASLREVLTQANAVQQSFVTTANKIRDLPSQIQAATKEMQAFKKAGETDLAAQSKDKIKNLTSELTEATRQINEARRNLQVASEARAQGQERLLAAPLGGGGRTLGDAQDRNRAVGLITAALNTDDAQMAARIADAAAKAAERLVKTAEASLVARFNQVGISEQIRRETYGDVTVAQAALTRSRIGNERLVSQYGPGTPQTLAGQQAAAQQAAREKAAAQFERAVAEAENKQRDADAKALALREYNDAVYENKRRDANDKFLAVRQYNEAQDENKRRSAEDRAAALREYNAAQLENIVRDTRLKQAAIREYNEAQEENKRRDLVNKKLAQVESDIKKSAEKTGLDNQSRIARNLYNDAEAENRRLTPETASRIATRDSTFANKYGMERSAFSAQVKEENLSIEQQAALLRGLARDQKAANDAKRAAGTIPKVELTEEQKLQQRRQRQQQNNEALQDRLDDKGGATFFGFQAQIASNYLIFGAAVQTIRGAISAIVDFDDVLKQFQAITDTTNTEMQSFRGQLLGIASDSKFSVTEIAKVAITLGQTGLSAAEVAKALKPVVDLATASGSTLSQSVEAITAVLGAYGLEAARAADVSDVFVGALNRTKLTMEQLQLGIQYAANIARDSGVSFSELTATIGAISQAGVKSGSTIGTGVRQLLTELSAPTEKFRTVLKELGISLSDVDVKTNGLTGVLENLRNKGFTTADALRSLDLRAAAAFAALSGQGDRVKTLQQELLLSSAAADASTKANESLAAGFQRLQNSAFSVVDKAFNPMVEALKGATQGVGSLFQGLAQLGPILPIIGTGLASITAAAAVLKVGGLVGGLLQGASFNPATLAVAGGISALIAGGALVNYLGLLETTADKAAKRLDALKASENDIVGRSSTIDTNTNSINSTILQLIDRREKLNSDPILRRTAVIEAQKAFGEIGLSVSSSITNIDDLVEALQRLRTGLATQAPNALLEQLRLVREETTQLKILQEEAAKRQRNAVSISYGENPAATEFNPLEKFGSLQGSGFDLARQAITNPASLGSDALGAAGPAYAAVTNALGEARMRRAQAQAANDQKTVEAQDQRLALLLEFNELLQKSVGSQTNINAQKLKEERLQVSSEAASVLARPDVRNIINSTDSIYEARNISKVGILGDKSTNDEQKRELLSQSLETAKISANLQLSFLEDLAKDLQSQGIPKNVVDEALSSVRNRLSDVSKGVTEDLRQLFDSLASGAKNILNTQNKGAQLQIENALKAATSARDPVAISAAEAQIKSATDQQFDIIDKIAKMSVINPEEVESNGEVVRLREEAKENLRTQLEGYAAKILEARKKLASQLLDYRDQADTAEKAKIDKQISAMQKILASANTTPTKMQEVMDELNKALERSAEIAKRQNQTALEKALLNAPTDKGTAIPGASAPEGSVAKQIIDAANQRGADASMTRYLLSLGQLESGQQVDPAHNSSARGVFQFMPDTWAGQGGGDLFNIMDQVKNAMTFTLANVQAFNKSMGRAPTEAEMFLLHNQGSGGAIDLLKADPNARAADIVGRNAVTGQKADADISVRDFIDYLKGMYDRASAKTEGQSTSARQVLQGAKTDKDVEADENLRAQQEKARRSVQEAEDRRENARLAGLTKEEQTRLQDQASAVRRALNVTDANAANKQALDAIADLRNTKIAQDDLKNRNRSPDEKKEDADKINEGFRNQAETQALSAAEAIGRVSLKTYNDQIDQLKSEIKDLDRDSSTGKYDADHYNSLKQQLEVLEKQKDLRGQLESYDAQINSLNQSLTEIQSKGLGDRSQLLRITEQIAALEEKRSKLAPSVERSKALDASSPDLGKSLNQGIDDFEKQRGIKNNLGQLVDSTQLARKQISSALNVLGNAFDNFFVNLFNGSMKAGEALKKFATDILSGLLSQASKALTNSIFAGLFGTSGGGSLFSSIGSLFGAANGGMPAPIAGMANGGDLSGLVTGGIPNRDSVPRNLMPGEFVLRRSAVQGIGRQNLEMINAMGNSIQSRAAAVPQMPSVSAAANSNVYVVSPEFPRQLGPNDIIHVIGDDIQTNGQIAKLVKSVTAGHF